MVLFIKKQAETLLNKTERLGLQYYDEINTKIPREETQRHVDFMKAQAKSIQNLAGIVGEVKIECTGSFRRGEKKNGDIDFVLSFDSMLSNFGRSSSTSNKSSSSTTSKSTSTASLQNSKKLFGRFLLNLEKAGYLRETLATAVSFSGRNEKDFAVNNTDIKNTSASQMVERDVVLKWMGLCKLPSTTSSGSGTANNLHRRVDILFVSREAYPFTLLHFTGDTFFNIELRRHALKQGYSLSEHYVSFRCISICMLTSCCRNCR